MKKLNIKELRNLAEEAEASTENRGTCPDYAAYRDAVEEPSTILEILDRLAISEGRHLPTVCFTCGNEASKIIYLPNGCAALPMTQGYVGICPQHEYSIEPIKPYQVIAEATPASAKDLVDKLWNRKKLPIEDKRPEGCRYRLMDEGKPYPRSRCNYCNVSINTGLKCPY